MPDGCQPLMPLLPESQARMTPPPRRRGPRSRGHRAVLAAVGLPAAATALWRHRGLAEVPRPMAGMSNLRVLRALADCVRPEVHVPLTMLLAPEPLQPLRHARLLAEEELQVLRPRSAPPRAPGLQPPAPGPAASAEPRPVVLSKEDMDRLKMRLDGLGTYAVVSALVVNMGIRLVSSTSQELMSQVWWPIGCTYCAALACCVLSGVYATIVFTLIKMFSKTAIGLNRDAACLDFFELTAKYRRTGCLAVCACLGSFAVAFLSFFLLRVRGVQGAVGFMVGLLFIAKGLADFRGMALAAGRIYA